jgi:hypothetical protein
MSQPVRAIAVLALLLGYAGRHSLADPVSVHHKEGLIHGFLVLRTLDGQVLADGDLTQVARQDRVTNHLVFRFHDGSVHDETTIFSQEKQFRLLSYRLIQKGRSFPRPLEVAFNASSGQVTVHSKNDDGKEKTATEHVDLPADVANGLVTTLLKNVAPGAAPMTVSMLAATPQPRLIKLHISLRGQEPFTLGNSRYKASHYVVKVDIGGLTGVLAQLLGKQPPDTHIWVLGGEAPVFVKSEGPMYFGGPVWRIELAAPEWPSSDPGAKH